MAKLRSENIIRDMKEPDGANRMPIGAPLGCACPDAGGARTASQSFGRWPKSPSVGTEGLRSATMLLNGGKVGALAGALMLCVAMLSPKAASATPAQPVTPCVTLSQTVNGVTQEYCVPAGGIGPVSQTSATVTTSSTTILAASIASTFIRLCVPSTASQGVWARWDGVDATQAPPADYISPGVCTVWVNGGGWVPKGPITAIASASTAISITYK